MTNEDIARIQQSWYSVAPVKRVAAELFYVKLFELDPTLKLLFSDDLKLRQQKFLQLMDATVNGLERSTCSCPRSASSVSATPCSATATITMARWPRR